LGNEKKDGNVSGGKQGAMSRQEAAVNLSSCSSCRAIALTVFFVLSLTGLPPVGASYQTQRTVEIPRQPDWVDRGVVFSAGRPGAWDARLEGMISPSTVVKKEGIYFLYYIGADGNRSSDGGPRHRALGVATSRDGIRFEKYSGNPVLTYLPNNNEEEGIFSVGGAVDFDGNILLYYGAMNAGSRSSTSVTSDVRLGVSRDGFQFTDIGVVLSHRDNSVWGYGDELFPVGSFHAGGIWHVYYIAKSGMRRFWSYVTGARAIYWDLGLAWGRSPEKLTNSKGVLASDSYIIGGGDPVGLGRDNIALFIIRDFAERNIEVRTALTNEPDRMSEPLQTYRFHDLNHATVFLDRETNTWFMYFLDKVGATVRVKTAFS
jgi:hypothetical protein